MTAVVEIIFNTHGDLVIRDVHEKWHKQVKEFMLEKYFIPHRLFNQMNYQDDPDINNQYLRYLDHILRDECSIIVLHKETLKIYAVALLKCMTTHWRSWTALQLSLMPCKFTDIVELHFRLIRDFATEFPEESLESLHMFEYFIEDDLKNDAQFMNKFFSAIIENARLMKMPRATFVALSAEEQIECEDQGYEHISRAIYSIYRLRNICPFAALRDIDEMEATLFEMIVEPLEPYYNMRVRGIDEVVEPKHDPRKSMMPTNTSNLSRRTVVSAKSTVGWIL